jgi:hypothetical protein
MPREGAIIFGDLVGKLEILRVECDKCGRRGRYHLDRLIERYGIDAKLFDWSDEIHGGLPTKAGEEPQRYVRCAVSGFVKGRLGFGIAYPGNLSVLPRSSATLLPAFHRHQPSNLNLGVQFEGG